MADGQGTGDWGDSQVEYRGIPGFPGYRAGSDRTIWSCFIPGGGGRTSNVWRKRKTPIGSHGYPMLSRRVAGKSVPVLVHRLVLLAFVGPPADGQEACHWNGVRSDCRAVNLRWGTSLENKSDCRRHGTNPSGEKCGTSKLTSESVREIRRLYSSGKWQQEIADMFGVSNQTVSRIVLFRTWKEVI